MKFICILLSLFISMVSLANEQKTYNQLTSVTVQLKWRHQFQFAGYYAAIEQGYYADKGLDVTLLERQPGPTPIDKLIIGNVDYAIGGVGALAYRANDVPLVALATIFQHSPSTLISRYKTLAELKDKKVMLTLGVMNAEIVSMFASEGISLSELNVIPTNQSIDGYLNQEIDAYNGYTTNELYKLSKTGAEFYSLSPKNFGIDFYGDVLLTTEQKLKSDIQQVQDFREATIKGWQYAIINLEETVDLIKTKYNSQNKTQEALLYEASELIKLIYANIVPIGYMNKQRWQKVANTLYEAGELKNKNFNIDGFIYSTYIKKPFLDFLIQHAKKLVVISFCVLSVFLFIHNYRLKLLVKERTLALDRAKEKAELEARTDNLTRLANRRHFMEAVSHDFEIAKRNALELSIIYIDIDFFKAINDKLGHAAGDHALLQVARVLRKNTRASDTAARIGGEEFVIACLEKNQSDTCTLAERIRKEVEQLNISFEKSNFKLTISLGVSSISGNETLEQTLKMSDSALYKAKELGRNQVHWL